jgi:hypothetical protein
MTLTTELEHLVDGGDVRFEGCKQGILIHPMPVNWRSARLLRVAKSHAEWRSVEGTLSQMLECSLHSVHSACWIWWQWCDQRDEQSQRGGLDKRVVAGDLYPLS